MTIQDIILDNIALNAFCQSDLNKYIITDNIVRIAHRITVKSDASHVRKIAAGALKLKN